MESAQLSADDLRQTHPRLRADRLRAALRGGESLRARVHAQPADWLALLQESEDPALSVLLLELFEGLADASLDAQLERLRHHRAEGVRLGSLRLICARDPARISDLVREYRLDSNLELRVFLGSLLFELDSERGVDFLLAALLEEAGGLRERHALERVLGFLVEEKQLHALRPRLEAMREDFDDPEDYFGWALAKLTRPEGGS